MAHPRRKRPPVAVKNPINVLCITLGVIITGCLLYALGAYGYLSAPVGGDFINYWSGPAIAAADPTLFFDLPRYHEAQQALLGGETLVARNWSYPLHNLFFFAPFAALPYLPALLLWSLLGAGLFLYTLRRVLPLRLRLALLVSPAALVTFAAGQNGFFTAALFLGAFLLLGKRPVLAGILLGILTLKPQLGLLWPLVLLALGAWRCIAAATLTALLLIGASFLVHGAGTWQQFFTFTGDTQWELLTAAFTPHLYQLMMPSLPVSLRILAIPAETALWLQGIVSFGVAAGVAVGFRRTADMSVRALLLTSGALLVTPYCFNYDMLAVSAALLWRLQDQPLPLVRRTVYMLAYLVPALVYVLHLLALPLAFPIMAATFVLALREALSGSTAS